MERMRNFLLLFLLPMTLNAQVIEFKKVYNIYPAIAKVAFKSGDTLTNINCYILRESYASAGMYNTSQFKDTRLTEEGNLFPPDIIVYEFIILLERVPEEKEQQIIKRLKEQKVL